MRDADLPAFGSDDIAAIVATFRDICAIPVDDGFTFPRELDALLEVFPRVIGASSGGCDRQRAVGRLRREAVLTD